MRAWISAATWWFPRPLAVPPKQSARIACGTSGCSTAAPPATLGTGGGGPGTLRRAPSAPPTVSSRRPRRARLIRRGADGQALATLLDRFGIHAGTEFPDGVGDVSVEADGRRLVLHADGSYEVTFAEPDRTASLAAHDELRAAAENAIQRFRVAEGLDLVYDRMTATYHAGGSITDGEVRDTRVADVTVHYRQLIDGVPVVMGREGHVRVTLDPSGSLTRVLDRTRPIRDLLPAAPGSDDLADPDAALTNATQILLRALSANGMLHDRVQTVPNTTEIGYRLQPGKGTLVARREVEVSTGRFSKRHVIEVPL